MYFFYTNMNHNQPFAESIFKSNTEYNTELYAKQVKLQSTYANKPADADFRDAE